MAQLQLGSMLEVLDTSDVRNDGAWIQFKDRAGLDQVHAAFVTGNAGIPEIPHQIPFRVDDLPIVMHHAAGAHSAIDLARIDAVRAVHNPELFETWWDVINRWKRYSTNREVPSVVPGFDFHIGGSEGLKVLFAAFGDNDAFRMPLVKNKILPIAHQHRHESNKLQFTNDPEGNKESAAQAKMRKFITLATIQIDLKSPIFDRITWSPHSPASQGSPLASLAKTMSAFTFPDESSLTPTTASPGERELAAATGAVDSLPGEDDDDDGIPAWLK